MRHTLTERKAGTAALELPPGRGRRRESLRRPHGLCLTLAGVMLLAGCATTGAHRPPPSAADSAFAFARLNEVLLLHTTHKAQRDVGTRLALGLPLERMPSLYTTRDDARYARSVQRDLERVRYDALVQSDYVSLHAVHWQLGIEGEASIYRDLNFAPLVPGNSGLGAIARALALHRLTGAEDLQRYLFLLDDLTFYFPQLRQLLVEQSAAGVHIPLVALDSLAVFLEEFSKPAAASPFALSGERLAQIDSLSRDTVRMLIAEKIERGINPSIDSLVAYVRGPYRHSAEARADSARVGLEQFPGGREYYRYLLRSAVSIDTAAEELLVQATREVERITAAMEAVRRRAGFNGSDSAFRDSLLRRPGSSMPSAAAFEERVGVVLSRYLDSVRTRFGMEVPRGLQMQPDTTRVFDGSRWLELREADALEPYFRLRYAVDHVTRVPAFVIPALVARELVPGRYTLLSAIHLSDSLPVLRQLLRVPAVVDGWSDYARGLAGELGLYEDEAEAYGALMLELEAAAQMVVDLGIHYFGWPYPQAVRYLREYAADASTAASDVLRIAVAEPARAVGAKIGSRELAGLRAWVRSQLGEAFDDGAFHREIMRVGVLPLPLLSQHLHWWVVQTRTAAAGRSKEPKER